MFVEHEGDLFGYSNAHVLAHGCNTMGYMGAGIAKTFRSLYPEMYVLYKQRCLSKTFGLGDVMMWKPQNGDKRWIANLMTQTHTGSCASLQAIEQSMSWLLSRVPKGVVVAIPEIGCGLGGLDYHKQIKPLLQRLCVRFPEVTLVVCSL